MAWWTWAETRYETPFTMRYEHLDPKASYKIRVVMVGRAEDPRSVWSRTEASRSTAGSANRPSWDRLNSIFRSEATNAAAH